MRNLTEYTYIFAQAINKPNDILRPTFGKTKLKYDVNVGYTIACVIPINHTHRK